LAWTIRAGTTGFGHPIGYDGAWPWLDARHDAIAAFRREGGLGRGFTFSETPVEEWIMDELY